MSDQMERLEQFGFKNLDVTRARFLDDDEFFLSLLLQLVESPEFDDLGNQLRAGDGKTAFETAHMLKGVIANCGITPMSSIIEPIVEELRKPCDDPRVLVPSYDDLLVKRDELRKLLS